MQAQSSWLHQGFFVLGASPTFTEAVRGELCRSLNVARGHFSIGGFPAHQGVHRHTVWWREGKDNYSEAQFFAHGAAGPTR